MMSQAREALALFPKVVLYHRLVSVSTVGKTTCDFGLSSCVSKQRHDPDAPPLPYLPIALSLGSALA